MSNIKTRRLALPVDCHQGDYVGDYVPFYFCPRSVMLYLLFKSNHPDLSYRGGQGPIVHLEADLNAVVAWASGNDRRWAFSLSNAGAYYAQFRRHLDDLKEIDWQAVFSNDFRSADIKESKAAELLLHASFPWGLVERVGVHSMGIGQRVTTAVTSTSHIPKIEIRKDWYF